MKTTIPTYLKLSAIVLSATIILFSCGPSREEKSILESIVQAKADSIASTTQHATAKKEVENAPAKNDSLRAFIRKADLRFKVKDVKNATFDIERIVDEHRGYVTVSDLQSTINYNDEVRINEDSMQTTKHYVVQSHVIIRVPNQELNKTLSEIAGLIDYLDHRTIKAEDITKQLSSASMQQQRFMKHEQRLEKAIDEQGKKLNSTVDAENTLYAQQTNADDVNLNAQELKHDVAYSTISIVIYQKETTATETYAYAAPIKPYQPPFGHQFITALKDGGAIFGAILLFFVRLWPLVLIGIGVFAGIKLILKRKWFA